MQRNSLCNLLVFHYNVPSDGRSFLFTARLLYADPCCSLPTEAIVSCTREWTLQVPGVAPRMGGDSSYLSLGTERSKLSYFCRRKELSVGWG